MSINMKKLNERVKILGIYFNPKKKVCELIIQQDNSIVKNYRIYKRKKGMYININREYHEIIPAPIRQSGKASSPWYLKDELWWSVNRFMKFKLIED